MLRVCNQRGLVSETGDGALVTAFCGLDALLSRAYLGIGFESCGSGLHPPLEGEPDRALFWRRLLMRL